MLFLRGHERRARRSGRSSASRRLATRRRRPRRRTSPPSGSVRPGRADLGRARPTRAASRATTSTARRRRASPRRPRTGSRSRPATSYTDIGVVAGHLLLQGHRRGQRRQHQRRLERGDRASFRAARCRGLVGAWGFDEGSGTTTADQSGSSNTGTLSNATWSTLGKFGNALSFNGTNASVTVPDSNSLDLDDRR